MNFANPFRKLYKDEDKQKERLKKEITAKAWDITKLTMAKRLKMKDINDLELCYERYFHRYPDDKEEENARVRIAKLKQIM